MIEHWERTRIEGHGPEGREALEVVLHRRGEDALQIAMRRNPELAACSKVEIRTAEAFTRIREDDARRTAAEIPRDERKEEEWDW